MIFIKWGTLKLQVLDKKRGHSGGASNRIKSSDTVVWIEEGEGLFMAVLSFSEWTIVLELVTNMRLIYVECTYKNICCFCKDDGSYCFYICLVSQQRRQEQTRNIRWGLYHATQAVTWTASAHSANICMNAWVDVQTSRCSIRKTLVMAINQSVGCLFHCFALLWKDYNITSYPPQEEL